MKKLVGSLLGVAAVALVVVGTCPPDAGADVRAAVAPSAPFDPCRCDIYHDHVVDLRDIPFLASDYATGSYVARSDFNRDGALNLIDVTLMATAVGASGCP